MTRTLFSYTLLFVISVTLFAASCKKKEVETEKETETAEVEKQPSADFTFDKSEYVEGETISLSNTSTNASTYRWTLPDGQTSKESTISYKTDVLSLDRTIQFKLEAFSKSGAKTDLVVRNVQLKAQTGQLIFHSGYFTQPMQCTITIDGVATQTILPKDNTIPDCGQAGFPNFTLKTGTHFVNVQIGSSSIWSGNVTINTNACTKKQVP